MSMKEKNYIVVDNHLRSQAFEQLESIHERVRSLISGQPHQLADDTAQARLVDSILKLLIWELGSGRTLRLFQTYFDELFPSPAEDSERRPDPEIQ